ncbi:hypothetical protein [Candidatus Halobonum tyrrellensis]|uniref:Membrane-bound metal-dependent hydrolase n=1 Tax=Candidatus Halobonum tyrrellensis G22 TaxID=1324957 RepID=V4GWU9_9EURY|nr:hypothetical protein [Candidatus Halobonum tyrrellensis]ESP89656.1 hypothetical protein K933_03026 [Candidatus Halobonum tyrrellensis G22]
MMATTHALVGGTLGAAVSVAAPELAPVALPAGAAGGLFPDLDLYAGHRRTLHFPVYYWLAASAAAGVAVVAAAPLAAAVAVFLLAAACHSAMDALGGGLELRPWEGSSDRAVYDHFRGRWVAPRRWVRYDGAPEDLLVATAAAAPTYLLAEAPLVRRGVLALVAVSAGYVVLRRPLATLAERVAASLPAPVRPYLPERFLGR